MDDRRVPQPAPDYTTAFLAMAGLILFMALFTLAALAGWGWVLLVSLAAETGLRRVRRPHRT